MKSPIRHSALALITASISIVGLSACDKDVSDAINHPGEAVRNSELLHTFTQSACNTTAAPMVVLAPTYKITYDFNTTGVTRTNTYFSDTNCATPITKVKYEGTYVKGDPTTANVFQLNLHYSNVLVTGTSDAGITALKAFGLGFCGHKDWAINAAVDVSADSRDATCPLENLPEDLYDIYTVDGNALYFGTGADRTTAANRSTEIDRSQPYQQE